jgi:biofilm PGA synthesis N-glycosyltransferase PgaC
MVMVVVVSFLDEERCLGPMLDSMAAQTRPPDRLLLVDDGSSDASGEIAAAFARAHPYASLLRREARPPTRDRLVAAPELRAFGWALGRIDVDYDVVVKMDADLLLPRGLLAEMQRRFEAEPRLGIAGPYLSASFRDVGVIRERNPAYHVRGPAKFYRRECLEQVMPLPHMLGWDTIDEVRARMHGWTTRSFESADGDVIHMRPTGSHDGILRGFRRDGDGAYRYGAHPLHVALGAVNRLRDRPFGLGGAHYIAGWALAAARRVPRAEPEVRAHARREQLRRIRAMLADRRAP